ncbi:MAG: hypothetical protein WBW84_22500 [Acidobacteriaceae bacterium]
MIEGKQAMREPLLTPLPKLRRMLPRPQFVMLAVVRLLYGGLLLSTVAIVWVAVAVARHIVQHRRAIRSQAEAHDDPV